MNTYQIHVDTGSVINVAGTNTQPIVSKSNTNPFQCTVLLGNRHRAFHEVSLSLARVSFSFFCLFLFSSLSLFAFFSALFSLSFLSVFSSLSFFFFLSLE